MKAVSAPDDPPGAAQTVFISVPKKIVRLATRRNRLKRVLREAVRADKRFKGPGKAFQLRVARVPADDGLAEAKRALDSAYEDWKGSE